MKVLGGTWKDLKGLGRTKKGLDMSWRDLEGLETTWKDLKELKEVQDLVKCERQKTDGVNAKATTREACASKNDHIRVLLYVYLNVHLF